MKKHLTIVLAALVVLALLAGCSGGGKDNRRIRLWSGRRRLPTPPKAKCSPIAWTCTTKRIRTSPRS